MYEAMHIFNKNFEFQKKESLTSMVHFPFNHVKELELSHHCAKWEIKACGRSFSTVI